MSLYVKQLDTLLESCIKLPGVLATFLFALLKLFDKQFKFGFTAEGGEAHSGEEGGCRNVSRWFTLYLQGSREGTRNETWP